MEDRRSIALEHFDKHKNFMDTVVESNIERYRKGYATLNITDKNGTPITGATIKATQKNHEFKYGANIFMLDELETEKKNQIYKDSFKEIFNIATIPFYWNDLEPEQGKPRYEKDSPKIYRRPATDLCVDFCIENNIEPKCHCLNYDNCVPKWLKEADVAYHKKMLEKRFRELSQRYADVIPSWEVTNETFNAYDQEQSKFYREDDFVEWSFRMADRYFPCNHLIINDYSAFAHAYRENRSEYYMQIERLFTNGISHLDSIGMQFHSFFDQSEESQRGEKLYNPLYLYEVLDMYGRFNKKIQMTEITIPAYSDSQDDEDVQAELIEKLYTVFFSHPNMEAIIYWNLVDGYAAQAEPGDMTTGENKFYGGLMNFDLSKKKAYYVIKDLFSKKWHTESECKSDKNGEATFRGFYGEYDLEIESNGQVITKKFKLLEKKHNTLNIVI
ncbi:MAG: endo-1,4-beta-xylanase [Eubacteriales bacterium]|nr:endo-1,4-beta-xylanase [Eubacteriales bacterium]